MERTKRRDAHSEKRSHRTENLPWAGWLVVVVATLLYVNTLGHDFVFDDISLILQNPQVTNLDWWGIIGKSGYRPVRTLTYALNYALTGENPVSYHAFNVLVHALNAWLLLVLVQRLTQSRRLALAVALLFAAHPAQTAAVAYISGRKDLLATGLVFTGLIFYLRWRSEGGRKYGIAALMAFLLAVLAKEVAIVFPVLILLVDAYVASRDGEGKSFPSSVKDRGESLLGGAMTVLRSRPFLYLTFVACAAAALGYALFIVRASRMEGYWGGTWETNLGTSFKLFLHYARLAVLGYPLVADYLGAVFPISKGFSEPSTLLAVGFALGYGIVVWKLQRSHPLVAVGLCWFAVGLLPVLQLIPFHELAADHFLYLPLAGFSLVLGSILAAGTGARRNVSVGCLVILLGVWSVMVVRRNADWRDKQSLWEATLRQAPGSFRANANLGQVYFNLGRHEEGIRLTLRALELAPDRALPYANLGAMYLTVAQEKRRRSQYAEAEQLHREAQEYLEEALKLEPGNPFTCSNLAITYKELALIYEATGRSGQAPALRARAAELFQKALRMHDPRKDRLRIYFNLGLLEYDANSYEAAKDYLEAYVRHFPDDPSGHYWLGMTYFRLGRFEDTVRELELGLEARSSPEAWETLLEACRRTDRLEKAEEVARRWVAEDPGPWSYYGLSRLLWEQGRGREAEEWLDKCVASRGGEPWKRSCETLRQELASAD